MVWSRERRLGRLTTLAEMMQGLRVSLQVFVDGVALVVGFQDLQHVQERQVLFRVLGYEVTGRGIEGNQVQKFRLLKFEELN